MDNQQRNLNNQIIQDYLNGESANKIAKKYSKNISSVMYLLRKNKIQIRTISESVIKARFNKEKLIFSKEFNEILIGLLMGDGCLRINKNGRNPNYTHTDKNLEAIKYFKEIFEKQGIKCSNIWINKINKCYMFQTECRTEYIYYYNLFYPNNNKKILPNVEITPLTLMFWYIGDGSVKTQSGTRKNASQISNKWGNDYILQQLKNILGNCKYYKDLNRNCGSFYFSHKNFIKMLNYIGECPIECYKYKWLLGDVQRL